ncbi:MAG: hypothetical protein COA45_01600 [Zetaproteobacteria bacterium]|nr:MAG: hypothetical protein COA45_01600 [Zetaproteobacteria bacterium]
MTQLSSFSDDDIELIVSLPYRVGMHVSFSEDEEGEQDDEREMRALESCIKEIAKLYEGSELTKEIALEVLRSRDKWESWSQGVFNIEPQCEKAVLVLKAQASEAEVKSYIKMILEIASAVAQAYGEFGEEPAPEKGFFGKALSRIVGEFSGLSSEDANHPMNVSAAEDSAISSIAVALRKNA